MPPVFPDFAPTIPGVLEAGLHRYAERECVVTPEARLTFADLESRSRVLAGRLLRAGVGKGSRVGVLFPNSIDWVVAFAAAARLGAIVAPVNTFYKTPELANFMRHADIQYVIGVGSFIQHDYIERLESIAPSLSQHQGDGPLSVSELPHLRRVLLSDESDRSWAEALFTGNEGRFDDLVRAMGDDVHPGEPLVVTYTSGSTGEPKGVVHSHGGVIRHARNLAALSNIDSTSRIWTPMPLCWVGGFAYSLLRAIVVGGCFLTQEVFEPGAALRMMEKERVTNVAGWPAVSKAISEHPDFPSADLSSLRGAASFYDGMPPGRRPPDPGLNVSSLGMSETCGPHTFWRGNEEIDGVPEAYRGAFGHAVPGVEHRIVDPDTGEDLPAGQEGEVCVRGYSLMLGLYKKERQEVFDSEGWYHTGDRGYFRDGWFFYTGRQTEMIKTSGSNVAPSEVERSLLGVNGVKLAFVVGVAHPERGQDVTALLVPRMGASLDTESIRQELRSELSSYKVPRQLFVISEEEVPWLVSQKVDRRALLTMAEKLASSAVRSDG